MSTEDRIASLEKLVALQQRRFWFVLFSLLLIGSAWYHSTASASSNQKPPSPTFTSSVADTIKASKFVLVDSDGNVRASLGVAPSGPVLVIGDEAREPTVMVVSGRGYAGVACKTKGAAEPIVSLVVSERSGGMLGITSEKHKGSVVVDAEKIVLRHPNGKLAVTASTDSEKGQSLVLWDKSGTATFKTK